MIDDRISESICFKKFVILLVLAFLLLSIQSFSQENLIQIKIFDQNLNPISNLSISINGNEFIPVHSKSAFYDIIPSDLPPKSVKINKTEYEAESWNYSKGTLEVIVRKKNYKLLSFSITNKNAQPINNVALVFNGKKKITTTTNNLGIAEIPLALDETLTVEKLSIQGYRLLKLIQTDKVNTLQVEPIVQIVPKVISEPEKPAFIKDFSLTQLDSISSLTVFYGVLKQYDISKLDENTQKKIEAKFNQLVNQLQNVPDAKFINKISDSSFVDGDVKSLLERAKFENTQLNNFKDDFDKKIKLINDKLTNGTEKLNAAERASLLTDLNLLENILRQNESKFYKNISDYRSILSSIKVSFLDIQNLENKLSISERKRLEEQRNFRNKIITVVSIAVVFGVLIIVLIILRSKLARQRKNLIYANDEIKRVNDNLEKLVYERTRLLIDAYREMDIFLYRSSHDLRAPICSIIGLCNLAIQSNTSNELIDKISLTAFKMDKLLNKLRFVSEINQPSNYCYINLLEKIEGVKQKFAGVIHENKIDFSIECANYIAFYSYAHLIEIIIYNIVDNAIFFSSVQKKERPKVIIKAKLEDDTLVVGVYDNGIGIEPSIRPRMCDMFFVGHESSHGNGLGLYIVDKSVQALNGKMQIESEVNDFTIFTITIPVNTQQTALLVHARSHMSLVESV